VKSAPMSKPDELLVDIAAMVESEQSNQMSLTVVVQGAVITGRRVRPADADGVGRDLDEARAELVQAREGGADEETEQELVGEWQRRLLRVLRDDPAAAEELRRVLEAAQGAQPAELPAGNVQLQARAEGSSRIYQAGRDMRVQGS
uniref:hypothetical protein n=1 Tax=Streptomyces sp. WAC01526 TaxID=2588709 RepID=UPI001CA33DC2